jgi:Poly(ADP-ribose) polymerase and DNA-Ligase Zn-finger region
MGHVIEMAKSGRSTCRVCKQGIPKGELRFGEETVNAFSESGGTSFVWHHLKCAAQKKPYELDDALKTFDGEVPDREALEATRKEAEGKVKPRFPYAERSPSARSKCIVCGETLEKGVLRIAIESDAATAGFMAKSARYLHPGCATEQAAEEGFLDKVKTHSRGLTDEEIAALDAALV